MKLKVIMCLFPFLWLFHVSNVFSLTQDTIPPTYTWISPEPYSIHRTNSIRLCVDAHDNIDGTGIEKVVFYAGYYGHDGRKVKRHIIGEVKNFPYEFFWNCYHIPDQLTRHFLFFCDVIDRAGNVTSKALGAEEEYGPSFVLDRNPGLNDEELLSHKAKGNVIIDGNLSEWILKDSIVFSHNDNRITAYSMWDINYLFFGVRVEDKNIISHFKPGSENVYLMSMEDIIEIYLDVNHNHYEMRDFLDRQFLIAPAGMIYERRYSNYIRNYINSIPNITPNVEGKVTIQGTLDDTEDVDNGYTVEFAVSWKELGIKPEKNKSMGLEIWNNDKDFNKGNFFYAGWTMTASNLNNASEWGNIVLVDSSNSSGMVTLGVFAVLCIFSMVFIVWRKKTYTLKDRVFDSNESELVIESELIKETIKYIEEHYSEETVSLKDVARLTGVTSGYLGQQFKKETGCHFHDYLNIIRINESKKLLLTTRKHISEIAYSVGFNSQSYFGSIFKKNEKTTPKEFRKKSLKSPKNLKYS